MTTNVRNLSSVDWESGPDRKLANNTYRVTRTVGQHGNIDAEWTPEPAVVFHATVIIQRKSEGAYKLNSGGYRTVTTKQRLNALLPGGISVYQQNHDWFVSTRTGVIPFTDGMTVTTY